MPQPARTVAAAASSALVGRQGFAEAVDQALTRAAGGSSTVVALVGGPGTGKSTMLDLIGDVARGRFLVAGARGQATEQDQPFAYADQLFLLWGWPLVAAARSGARPGDLPDGAGGDPMLVRAALFGQARAVLRQWAQDGPVVLLLDDLQWADPDSLAMLRTVMTHASRLPVAVVAAMRPWPDRATGIVRALQGGLGPQTVTVADAGDLDVDATRVLLSRCLDGPVDRQTAIEVWQLAKGNPLLTVELADVIARGELASVGLTGSPTGPVADRIVPPKVLLRHLVGLPDDALRVAQAAAVTGVSAGTEVVRSVAELPVERFAEALDALVSSGTMHVEQSGSVAFVHDLVAGLLVDDMTAGQRMLFHRRAYEHFSQLGDPDGATRHALGAGMVGDATAVSTALAAADRAAQVGAVEATVDRLATALALAGPTAGPQVRSRYAEALFWAGRPSDAADSWVQSVRQAAGTSRPSWLVGMARAEAYAGRLGRALVMFDDAVRQLGAAGSVPSRLVVEWGHVIWELSGPVAAARALGSVPTAPEGIADAERLHVTEQAFAFHAGAPVAVADLARAADRALARLRRVADTETLYDLGNIVLAACGVLSNVGRVDDAGTMAAEAIELLEAAGATWPAVPLRIVQAGLALRVGRPAQTLAVVDDLADAQLGRLLDGYVGALRAQALAWLGRPWPSPGPDLAADPDLPWVAAVWWRDAAGRRLWGIGDWEAASDCYRLAEQVAAAAGCAPAGVVGWQAGAVEAHLACGRTEDVERIVDQLAEVRASGGHCDARWVDGVVAAGRAGLAVAAGDHAGAELAFEQALRRSARSPLDQAAVALRYGTWLRRQGAVRRARTVLGRALATAEGAGAQPLAQAVAQELAGAGGRQPSAGRRRPDRSPSTGIALTPQQWRAAEHAAAGATVKEVAAAMFVSPRTAEAHLRAAYRAFGVQGKAELRRRWQELTAQHTTAGDGDGGTASDSDERSEVGRCS